LFYTKSNDTGKQTHTKYTIQWGAYVKLCTDSLHMLFQLARYAACHRPIATFIINQRVCSRVCLPACVSVRDGLTIAAVR